MKVMRRFYVYIAVLVLLAILAGACTPVTSTPVALEITPKPTEVSQPTQEVAEPQVQPGEKFTIGMEIPHRTNPFWVAWADAATLAAENLGIELVLVDHQNKEEKQIETLEGLIARGLDALIVTPHNSAMGPAVIALAKDNNLPMILTDRYPGVDPGPDTYMAFIGLNDELLGYGIASELLEMGCTKILVNNGLRGHSGYESRSKGVDRALAEHPEVEILDQGWYENFRQKGTETAEAWLTRFPGPEFDCLYGGNDDWTMGAWKVLSDAGVADKVKLAGLDAIAEVTDKIIEGEIAVSGGGHWFEGAYALVMMYDYLNGVPLTDIVFSLTDVVVTPENASDFKTAFYDNPPQIDWSQRSRFLNPSASASFSVEELLAEASK